jgi:hypothetical protein
MIAVNLDNILFLLLVLIAGLFQLLAKAATKKTKDQTKRASTPPAATPVQRAPAESNGDRIRKLLEALGQPPTSTPPSPVVPRKNIPPRPLTPVKPPPPPLSQLSRDKSSKRKAIPKEIPPAKVPAPAAFDVHRVPSPITPAQISKPTAQSYADETRPARMRDEPRAGVALLLASSSGLRDAIILREILGPPRGLRMADLL